MSSNAPKVLVINYDEKGDYAKNHEDAKESILTKIRSGTWDFIFLCTQKSLSNLISLSADTMQHVIGEEIKKNQEFSDNYTLFSKIDATRPLNSKKVIFSNDKKFRNVRIRCWRNINIQMPRNVNEMALKSTSYKGTENSIKNMYNTDERYNQLTGNDVRIVRYKYKRITGNDDLQRKRGDGAIIVSLTLEKYNQKNKKEEKYQYIICNYDSPRIKLGNISKNEASSVNQSTKDGVESYFKPLVNNMPINTIQKTSSALQKYNTKINIDNLFLTYVSCDSIVYKYLKIEGDPSFYSCLWAKNKRLETTNGKTHNLTLEQINDSSKGVNVKESNQTGQKSNQTGKPGQKKSMFTFLSSSSSVSPNYETVHQTTSQLSDKNKNLQNSINSEKLNLLNIIYDIYEFKLLKNYNDNLTIKENINNYDITKSQSHHKGVTLKKDDTTYNYILTKLKKLRSSSNNANSINLILSIWEKIDQSIFSGRYISKSSLISELEEYFNAILNFKSNKIKQK
jgi:hypothetical protein